MPENHGRPFTLVRARACPNARETHFVPCAGRAAGGGLQLRLRCSSSTMHTTGFPAPTAWGAGSAPTAPPTALGLSCARRRSSICRRMPCGPPATRRSCWGRIRLMGLKVYHLSPTAQPCFGRPMSCHSIASVAPIQRRQVVTRLTAQCACEPKQNVANSIGDRSIRHASTPVMHECVFRALQPQQLPQATRSCSSDQPRHPA